MIRLIDPATGALLPAAGSRLVLGAASDDAGTLLSVDTLARTAEVLGLRVATVGVAGVPELNVRPGAAPGPADVVVDHPGGVPEPPYGLGHRLAWLSGDPLETARAELTQWRRLVAGWAEEPSKPMCAEVQQDLIAALADDLRTHDAVAVLRRSLDLGLPGGCLFETWAWADRLLALDLASEVGR